MRIYDIIRKKRDGGRLSDAEIAEVIRAYTDGTLPDFQMSALTMAIWFNGMDANETLALTQAMEHSGDTVDLSEFGTLTVDKHSTGGVGDKISLIVIPIVAACGGIIVKMSGRGLGFTGGTVDKLETFTGYNTSLSGDEVLAQARRIGIVVTGQSGNLTPADKKLYALRDVTATVDSIPLIASSIMSKKLAAGAHSIVLDVKAGSGAFMKETADAEALARAMVEIGKSAGRNVRALITDMDTPLGKAVGNALEVKEAIDVLKGDGPEDVKKICLALSSNMIELCLGISADQAVKKAVDALESGRAYEKFCQWISAQGGDIRYALDTSLLPTAKNIVEVKAWESGYIGSMNAEGVGIAASMLGAGRTVKDGKIDHSAGIILEKKTGERVSVGDTVAYLHTNASAGEAYTRFCDSVKITEKQPKPRPIISGII